VVTVEEETIIEAMVHHAAANAAAIVIVKRHLESQEQEKNAHQVNQNQEALTVNNHREHGRKMSNALFFLLLIWTGDGEIRLVVSEWAVIRTGDGKNELALSE
jgi:hypothetical protein